MFKVSRFIVIILLVIALYGHACMAQQTTKDITLKPNKEIQIFLKELLSLNGQDMFSGTEDEFQEKLAWLEKMVASQYERLIPELLYYSLHSTDMNITMLARLIDKLFGIPKTNILIGLLPYLDSKDKNFCKVLNDWLGYLDMCVSGKCDFTLYETILRENKTNIPKGLIKYMYDKSPDTSLLCLANVFSSKKETMYLKEIIEDMADKMNILNVLSKRTEWWVHLYVIEKMRKNKRLWSSEIIERMKMSKNRFVQEGLSMLEELANLFTRSEKDRLGILDIQRIGRFEHSGSQLEVENIISKLAKDSNNIDLLLKLTSIEIEQGNFIIAIEIINKVVKVDPTCMISYFYLSRIYKLLGDEVRSKSYELKYSEQSLLRNQQSIKQHKEKIKSELAKKPDGIFLLLDMATQEKRQGNFEVAEGYLYKVIDIDPNNANALLEMAILEIKLGKFHSAEGHLSKIIEIKPNNLDAYTYRKNVYRELGDKEKLMEDKEIVEKLKKIEKIENYKQDKYRLKQKFSGSKNNYFYLLELARLETSIKNFEAAIGPLTKAIEICPEQLRAYRERSQVYKALDEQEKMEIDLRKIEELRKIRARRVEELKEKVNKQKRLRN